MLRSFRLISVLVITLAMLSLALACGEGNGDGDSGGGTPGEGAAGFPVTLQRSDGQELTLDAPPQRMVVLSPGHVEILFAIGAGDAVIAVDENTDYPPEAAAIETKLSGFEPSVEAVANLDPDLVIVAFDPGGFVEGLDNLGIPVFYDAIDSEVTTIEGVFESIEELGRATGRAEEARGLVDELRERVDAVVEQVEGVDGPRIYHELDTFEGFNTVAPGDFVGDLYNKLNAENIVPEDAGPYPTLQSEAIIEANPEVIVLADAEFGQTPEVVAARPGWEGIDAVQNDRIYAVDPDIFSRPGPRIVDALEELARLLYPDIFGEEASGACSGCSVPAA